VTRRTPALVAGAAGLAVLAVLGFWLHASSPDGAFPAVPGPGDPAAPPGPAAGSAVVDAHPAPVGAPPAAPPEGLGPSAALAPLLPDPVAAPSATVREGPTARTVERLASGRERGAGRLALLRGNALQNAHEAAPWLDLGREWVARGRTDLGRAAFRRAWVNARTDSDRDTVRKAWHDAGLPPGEMPVVAAPARRRDAR
jgi:hypothetical protein